MSDLCNPNPSKETACCAAPAHKQTAAACTQTAAACTQTAAACAAEKPAQEACGSAHPAANGPFKRFKEMIPNALAFVKDAKAKGQKVARIFCEYTPRELFFAAGVIPVCMCGGQESTIAEAEKDLPNNLCPLIKSSYGHALKKSNPFLEMADLLVAETTCDGKKKMYELLGRTRPMYVLELPQKPDESIAFAHWLEEIRMLKARIEELAGRQIGEPCLRQAIERMNQERDLRRELSYLAASNPPLISGNEVLLAKSIVSLIPCDLAAYRILIEEIKQRPSPYAGRPRILLTGVPNPHGAEKVMEIIESAGGAVVAQENCSGVKPIMDNISLEGDLLENLARKYFDLPCSCMTPNPGRIDLLDRLIDDFKPDGVVDLVWQACHTYNIESQLIRERARSTWNLPFLKLETDYSPSDKAQLSVRIEAFLELCSNRIF
jgi:benzoyl-CoA reductase/2-hydroxyglutaryl-CoA dehydratase subunit BcrC/BadD/HgdB